MKIQLIQNPFPRTLLFLVNRQAELNEAATSSKQTTTIEVSSVYQDSPTLRYTLRATLVNHLSRQEAVYNMKVTRNMKCTRALHVRLEESCRLSALVSR